MSSSVIQVDRLSKHYQVSQKPSGFLNSIKSLIKRKYKTVKAVQDISFQVDQGELVGFIGPNGAGKTTTLKLLSGLLYPDSGQVQVLGFNPWDRKPRFQKKFALVMGQKNQLFWDLPASESFLLLKDIYEIPDKKYQKNFNQLVDMLEVNELLDTPIRKLSLGQRMKMELIGSLLHSPKVLFLDEPTIGLDVIMQKKIREFINTYNQESQATIILTSHYMEDVRRLCKRVIVIDQGKLAYDGNLKKLIREHAPQKYLKVVFGQETTPQQLKSFGKLLKHHPFQATLRVDRQRVSSVAVKILEEFQVEDLTIEEPRIQDVISRVFNQHQA